LPDAARPGSSGEEPGRRKLSLRSGDQTINVLNAVPLMATASRKATAFSLIIRMVHVPCSVVVWEPGWLERGRGEASRARHYMEILT
jgi:hypothetical protein